MSPSIPEVAAGYDATAAAGASSNNTRQKEEKIQVGVRMRPLNSREKSSSNHGTVWQVNTRENTILQTTTDGVHEAGDDVYAYAHTFNEDSTTEEVYSRIGKPIVSDVIQGYHGTIGAYGQTSSGKTHTMQGSGNDEGIMHLAASDIFTHIDTNRTLAFVVRVSFIEIYNEDVIDLLVSSGEDSTLKVRQTTRKDFFVRSTEKVVASRSELLSVLSEGEKNRSVGATKMNEKSSRSHAIFRITVERHGENEDVTKRVSTLNLVDLAGSESVRHTRATGNRQKEGGKINQSLLALESVISSLAEKAPHVNYRDSNLTKLLQPSLSGNAKMAVICCATPLKMYLDQTRSTLKFADRAQMVTKTKAKKARQSIVSHSRRPSVASTPLQKMSKKIQFLSPTRLLTPGKYRAIATRHTQTDVRHGRSKRPSIISSSISEHDDEVSQLQMKLAGKNMRIAGLEAELQSFTGKLHAQRRENQELKSQVATLKAEYMVIEKQVQDNNEDQVNILCLDGVPPRNGNSVIEALSHRRESNDSDATEEYVITTNEMKRTEADSYDSIVMALGDSNVRVCELVRLVDKLQMENEELKRKEKTAEDTVAALGLGSLAQAPTKADDENAKLDETSSAEMPEEENICYGGGGDLSLLVDEPIATDKNITTKLNCENQPLEDGTGEISYPTKTVFSADKTQRDEVLFASRENFEDGTLPTPQTACQQIIPPLTASAFDESLATRLPQCIVVDDHMKAQEERTDELLSTSTNECKNDEKLNSSEVTYGNELPSDGGASGQGVVYSSRAGGCASDEAVATHISDENKAPAYATQSSTHQLSSNKVTPKKAPSSSATKQMTPKRRTPLGKATLHNIQSCGREMQKTARFSQSSKSTSNAEFGDEGYMSQSYGKYKKVDRAEIMATSGSIGYIKQPRPEQATFKYTVGTTFLKLFKHYGTWEGQIISVFDGERYEVVYEDRFVESFDRAAMDKIMAKSDRLKEMKVQIVDSKTPRHTCTEELSKPSANGLRKSRRKKSSAKKISVLDNSKKDEAQRSQPSTVDDTDGMSIYKEEALTRAKAKSQDAVATMINKGEVALTLSKDASCHICHYKRNVCLTFHCGKHTYCDKHCKDRLGFNATEYDPSKPSYLPIDYCPICTVSCECSKCGRKLEKVARDMQGCCREQGCEPADVNMNLYE